MKRGFGWGGLLLFFFSLHSFYSLTYDSAFLMFVVYRNKHEKVAFLLDVRNFGLAQEALMKPGQVRGI